ncbi:MAG: aldo/keto reductase [Calditrichaeota bacterium]|nr:aldo/keto reductase [Calditrichota bacterium]
MNRRQVIKLSSLSLMALKFGHLLKSLRIEEMLRRPIPSTGEELPVIGLGTWLQFDVSISDPQTEQLTDVLKLLLKNGGTLLDSSPMYGRSEERIGDLCSRLDTVNDFFYATKVWTSGKTSGIEQMKESLRKMRRQQMDLMQIHNLLDWREHLDTLKDWKEKGLIRYIGITHYTDSAHDELARIIRNEKAIDFVQFNYSIGNRHAERFLLDTAMERQVAVIINRPYEGGSVFSKTRGKSLPDLADEFGIKSWGQFVLKFILSHPAVNVVIPGTSKTSHLLDNVQAGFGPMPDQHTREKMANLYNNLK